MAVPLLKDMAPKGHAQIHSLQPMHLSRSTRRAPVLASFAIAFVGQTVLHGAGSHCSQIMGTFRQVLSILGIHIRASFRLNNFSLAKEQATMHALHPVQASRSKNKTRLPIH